MKFFTRLSRYLLGVIIGLTLTWIFFSERGCLNWLPSERIRKDIAYGGIKADEKTRCILKCGDLTVSDLADLAMNGKVNFNESGPREKPRRYYIESDGVVKFATFLLTDTASTVTEIGLRDKVDCLCD